MYVLFSLLCLNFYCFIDGVGFVFFLCFVFVLSFFFFFEGTGVRFYNGTCMTLKRATVMVINCRISYYCREFFFFCDFRETLLLILRVFCAWCGVFCLSVAPVHFVGFTWLCTYFVCVVRQHHVLGRVTIVDTACVLWCDSHWW